MGELVIRGVPAKLEEDAWWMADGIDANQTKKQAPQQKADRPVLGASQLVMLLGLVLLADLLFWEHPVGLSLVLFSAGLGCVAYASLRPELSRRSLLLASLLWMVFALPVLEYVQPVSVLFLVVGHVGILVWIATRSPLIGVLRNIVRMGFVLPDFVLSTCAAIVRSVSSQRLKAIPNDTLVGWVLPMVVGSVFLVLFLSANPVLENWADQLFEVDVSLDSFRRLTFWAVVAALVLPFVLFHHLAKRLSGRRFPIERKPDFDSRWINTKSITNSLFVFNVMFLFQNASDVTFLWGGATLPDGMSYASYAHKGAYPLMATSVLAGLFVLASRTYLDRSKWLRILLIVWVLQNVFLVISSLARLDLYIEVYGLTYLRLRALVGMWLVFVGMALLLWQLWQSKSNFWVIRAFAAVVLCVAYSCCFVNFGYVIAKTNLAQGNGRLDVTYLCQETRSGLQAIVAHAQEGGEKHCTGYRHRWSFEGEGWRDWSWRQSRLDHALVSYDYLPAGLTLQQVDDTRQPSHYQ